MTKPSIAIYREQKPAHYTGADISITLTYKSNLDEWQINLLEHMIVSLLQSNDWEDIEPSEKFVA